MGACRGQACAALVGCVQQPPLMLPPSPLGNPPSTAVRYISHLYFAFMAFAINDLGGRDGWGCPNSIPPPCSVSGDQVGGGHLHGRGWANSLGSTCLGANGFPWQRQALLIAGRRAPTLTGLLCSLAAWLCCDMLCCAALPPLPAPTDPGPAGLQRQPPLGGLCGPAGAGGEALLARAGVDLSAADAAMQHAAAAASTSLLLTPLTSAPPAAAGLQHLGLPAAALHQAALPAPHQLRRCRRQAQAGLRRPSTAAAACSAKPHPRGGGDAARPVRRRNAVHGCCGQARRCAAALGRPAFAAVVAL